MPSLATEKNIRLMSYRLAIHFLCLPRGLVRQLSKKLFGAEIQKIVGFLVLGARLAGCSLLASSEPASRISRRTRSERVSPDRPSNRHIAPAVGASSVVVGIVAEARRRRSLLRSVAVFMHCRTPHLADNSAVEKITTCAMHGVYYRSSAGFLI